MTCRMLLLFGLGAFALVGCKNQNQEPAARTEELYTPSYTSTSTNYTPLDTLDAAPTEDAATTYDVASDDSAEEFTVAPAETAEPDEPLSPVGGQVYTVQKGDTLYKLARQFYNDQARWRDIWEANRNRISDPDRIAIGTKLIIP